MRITCGLWWKKKKKKWSTFKDKRTLEQIILQNIWKDEGCLNIEWNSLIFAIIKAKQNSTLQLQYIALFCFNQQRKMREISSWKQLQLHRRLER